MSLQRAYGRRAQQDSRDGKNRTYARADEAEAGRWRGRAPGATIRLKGSGAIVSNLAEVSIQRDSDERCSDADRIDQHTQA